MDGTRVAVIIEDDKDIRDLIQVILQQAGFLVHMKSTGEAGVDAVRQFSPSIVTLDLGLPDIDGYEVARRIRQFSDSYIIMLTARAEELDTLMGLEAGADDYLTKPFRPRELRARVAAMMRRPRGVTSDSVAAGQAGAGQAGTTGPVPVAGSNREHNGLVLSSSTRTASIAGEELELTRTEFDLMHALLESGQTVRTKADLVRWLRAEEYDTGAYVSDADERAIEVHIGNLRRKLGDNSRAPRWLRTVRGVGYCLAPATTTDHTVAAES